ncbi:protein translocase subunit SecD [Rhodohalobacter sulfatireducens]|uniref:Protein translocase subunit SecD n=1 Tax=Rhodohalobacter sulfatireducens TaxID=2911366 RepID=A0ABS9KES4_9BACT|nr:protein translocase subunit SecD [Rhodohalobacter sulfatireducens]MCG2589326.1 protein translocase subunit SecD [Rhodohalobacter sulfatireducens]
MNSQNNGFKIGSIVVFLGLTIYYLFPTIQWQLEQRHMESMVPSERVQYQEENAAKLQNLREESLSLGLDLQGGMYVTLEVGTPQLLLELAGEYADEELEEIIQVARDRSFEQRTDFIDEFVTEFETRNPDGLLSRYYRSDADNINRRSSNEEITTYLRLQRDEAVDRAMEIIRSRVDRYGVTEPSILQQGNNRIVVELPGVDDEERVRELLRGTARLEFRLLPEPEEINAVKQQLADYFGNQAQNQQSDSLSSDTLGQADDEVTNLLEVFDLRGTNQYSFGYTAGRDTSTVNRLLEQEEVQSFIPRNMELMWGATPFAEDNGTELYEMIPVRNQVELTGDVISEARVAFEPTTNAAEVSMSMNAEGARRWSRITGANIGRPVAIVLDGYIYSYPTVQNKINNGQSSISGLGGVEEAEDLVNILLSGALPAPLDIIEERTVGASLGEDSIQAGLYSTLFGLVVVAIFMIIYYRVGGGIADLALILNIIFILGILAAFNATLTLPGIAGIVLTIGMAVDANVLIFDRIREEMRGGKTLRAAIDNGYSNAMSAIVDANVTTFFVAIILYSFGVGPIKGFAVTLMAGIVASLFSAIVITRVVIDYLTRDKTAEVNFG